MDVVFQRNPVVKIGRIKFLNCPTIIQVGDAPLMEVGNFEGAGFKSRVNIYHNDGTKLAVANGSQLYPTEEGKKAGVTLRHPQNMTVCELAGRTIFELRRTGPAALHGTAELYAPKGVFVKANDSAVLARMAGGEMINRGGITMEDAFVQDCPIGIHVDNKVVAIGSNGGPYKYPEGYMINGLRKPQFGMILDNIYDLPEEDRAFYMLSNKEDEDEPLWIFGPRSETKEGIKVILNLTPVSPVDEPNHDSPPSPK